MSVTKSFYSLNCHRPQNVTFGEVTCIELYVTMGLNLRDRFVGISKRKSVHVPASSNAYWNFTNLRANLVAYCSERGVKRQTRKALYAALREGVEVIHRRNLRETYSTQFEGEATQYFTLNLFVRDEVDHFNVIDAEVTRTIPMEEIPELSYTVVV